MLDLFKQLLSELESTVEAILTELYSHVQKVPTGKPRNPEVVQRYVRWMWRNRVLGHSIRGIAQDPGVDNLSVQPSDIRRGIRTARGLLGIAGQFWNDISDDDEAVKDAERFWALGEGDNQLHENHEDSPPGGE